MKLFRQASLRSVGKYNSISDPLGPIRETIRSRSAQIRSWYPDRPIAFRKRRSRSAHQIEKIRNQTVDCQLNHDINHSLWNLELKLHGRDWMKNVKLAISIHDITMGSVATSFMSVDTRASWPIQCTHSDCSRYNTVWTCMWLTSLKIYKLLTQDRPCSSKWFPLLCGF